MIEAETIRRAAPILDEMQKAELLIEKLRAIESIAGLDKIVAKLAGGERWQGQAYLIDGLRTEAGVSAEEFGNAIVETLIARATRTVGKCRLDLRAMGIEP